MCPYFAAPTRRFLVDTSKALTVCFLIPKHGLSRSLAKNGDTKETTGPANQSPVLSVKFSVTTTCKHEKILKPVSARIHCWSRFFIYAKRRWNVRQEYFYGTSIVPRQLDWGWRENFYLTVRLDGSVETCPVYINILICPQSEKYLVAIVVSTIFDGSPRSAGNMAEFSVSRCNERTISIRKLDQVVGISRRSVVDQDYALQPSLD